MRDIQKWVSDLLWKLVAARPDHEGGVLTGLVGRGILSSRSPGMHEREAARLGIPYSYLLVDFDRLELGDEALAPVIEAAQRLGFRGLNVTHPFKQAVITYLDGLSPEAAVIGAVNTIVLGDGRSTGHNTDSWGFAQGFREKLGEVPLGRVVQFGAGGAGAAVAYALAELGVEDLLLVDLDPQRAAALAQRLAARCAGVHARAGESVEQAVAIADGIVNATPVGMAKYPGMPFDRRLLAPRHWVAEIVYFPVETELLRQARAVGCRTLDGSGMAIGQAVRAFELFTGRSADPRAMAEHFAAAA